MTFSFKKSGPDGGSYYIDSMSLTAKRKGIDDYYTAGEKEPPGVWYVGPDSEGNRNTRFGIKHGESFVHSESQSSTRDFSNLISGFNPRNGEKLVGNAGKDDRVALYDFTASPPKSLSVVWSQADTGTKKIIEKFQYDACVKYLDFMSQRSILRDGKAGIRKTQVPMRGAIFSHGSSRENDPQPHHHCVIFNACELPDGTPGALEIKGVMKWQGAAASLWHADMAFGAAQLKFKIRKEGNLFEIDGVPEAVNKAFSQRREQILAAASKRMKELGVDPKSTAGRAMLQQAAYDTRKEKSELTRDELETLWHQRGKELGFTREEVNALMVSPPPPKLSIEELQQESRIAVQELTKLKSVFTEPDLVKQVAVQLMGRASSQQILESVEAVKKDLLSTELHRKSVITETVQPQEVEVVFTTQEMLVLEREMLEFADRQDGQHVLSNVDLPENLSPEQRKAALAAMTDRNAVTVIEGTAGAGKTFTMKAISRAYERAGYSVTGLAASWAAALNLKKEAKLAYGRAITGWVNKVRSGAIKLDRHCLIVIDEAGMVDARQMHAVLKLAAEAGAKVIPLGDTKQQKSPGAGDPLRCITAMIGSERLDEIRRQHRDEEKIAVVQFFDGHAKEGLKPYMDRGRIHIEIGNEATQQKMVDDWQESRTRTIGDTVLFHRKGVDYSGVIERIEGDLWHVRTEKNEQFEVLNTHLMLSLDKKSAMELNQLAHDARKEAGELGESRMIRNMDCRGDDQLEFSVGDEVVIRKTDTFADAFNRDKGLIESFADEKINIRTQDGRLIEMDPTDPKWQFEPEEPGLALQHAYATTIHSSQGVSVGPTFLKDHIGLSRETAGVGMSRHREDCNVYADKEIRHQAVMGKGLADKWKPIQEFSDEECLAHLASTWSQKREKLSTLDFTDWKKNGAAVDVDLELKTAQAEEALSVAKAEITRIIAESKAHGTSREQLQFPNTLDSTTDPSKTNEVDDGVRLDQLQEQLEQFKESKEKQENVYVHHELDDTETDEQDLADAQYRAQDGVRRLSECHLASRGVGYEERKGVLSIDARPGGLTADELRRPEATPPQQQRGQLEPHALRETLTSYRIPTPQANRAAIEVGLRKLDEAGLDHDVVERAIKQQVVRFDRNGDAVFCGRRPGDNSVVSTQGGENPRNGPLRGRYPPILQGDPDSDRVDVVGSGQDALKLWSTQARQGKPLSTVVVSSGRGDVMRMPHVLSLTEEAEVVEYHDQPEDVAVDKDFEAEKVKQQATTELAAEQELTRKSATRGLSP